MTTTPSLESVKQQFDAWRTDPNKARKIPSYLWDKVSELVRHYKLSIILSTLNLNSMQIKTHCPQMN